MDSTGRTAALYNKVSTAIVVAMTLVALLLGIAPTALAVAAVFHLLCSLAYGAAWKAVARRSPEALPKLHLSASAFRLMAAAGVLLVYCALNRHAVEGIKTFAIVFIVYYIVMLLFDAVFFAKVSKNSNQ